MGLAILNLIWKFYMEILNKAMSLFDVQVKQAEVKPQPKITVEEEFIFIYFIQVITITGWHGSAHHRQIILPVYGVLLYIPYGL